MNRFFVELVCNCGGKAFTASFTEETEQSQHTFELHKTLSHSGWGWELENFQFACVKCKGEPVVKVVLK